jgi:tRNA 2-thiouridine synthesizing protein A
MSPKNMTELDATGLKCPLPVLKARKAMKRLETGALLRVVATDPGSPADMRAFCESQGHAMESFEERDAVYTFDIRKG